MKLIEPSNPILWTPAAPVTDIPAAVELGKEMVPFMVEHGGAGLAAPQIGESKSVFVMRIGKNFLIVINPEVIYQSKHTISDYEGCLSMPGFRTLIERTYSVKFRFNDGSGIKEILFKNELARVAQHELWHLEGRCIFPRPT
jgi:peptide deformylase